MTRPENRRLVRDGGVVSVEYIPGAVISKPSLRSRDAQGSTGFARYSDEAYKVRNSGGGPYIRSRKYTPHVPDEVPPCEGWNKLRWSRGISALFPSNGKGAVFVLLWIMRHDRVPFPTLSFFFRRSLSS